MHLHAATTLWQTCILYCVEHHYTVYNNMMINNLRQVTILQSSVSGSANCASASQRAQLHLSMVQTLHCCMQLHVGSHHRDRQLV